MVPAAAEDLAELARSLLQRGVEGTPRPLGLCVATDLAQPPLLEACRQHRLGVLDQTGTLILQAGPIFLDIRGTRPLPKGRPRGEPSLTPSTTRLVRVLLGELGRRWKVAELASAANVSFGTSQAFLIGCEQIGFVRRDSPRSGFTTSDPVGLLRRWLEYPQVDWSSLEGFYAPSTEPPVLREAREEAGRLGIPVLFTLASAVREDELHVAGVPHGIYCSGDSRSLASALRLKRTTPHNFLILRPRREADTDRGGIFHLPRELDHGPGVSLPQLIKDFRAIAGRGKEQADFLLQRYLEQLPYSLDERRREI
jgi:hypothetical protein